MRTPSGGLHYYFSYRHDDVRNSAGRLGPGLDVRGRGGYVVAPPSVLRNGHAYKWLRDMGNLADLPKELRARLLRPQERAARLSGRRRDHPRRNPKQRTLPHSVLATKQARQH